MACTGSVADTTESDAPDSAVALAESPAPEPTPGPPFDAPAVAIPDDPCEAAWAEFDAFATELGKLRAPRQPPPDHQAFIEACGMLPAAARPCLSNAYAVAHADRCAAAMAAVDEALQKDIYRALSPRQRP